MHDLMDDGASTPESIRRQYAAPPDETPEQRRRRLANRRAAKYRHQRGLSAQRASEQREKSSARQRSRRERLDEAERERVREQNRRRQQLRRQRMSESARAVTREAQRQRQQRRRQQLDEHERDELRTRERLRLRRRRQLEREAANRLQSVVISPTRAQDAPRRLPQLRVGSNQRSILNESASEQLPSPNLLEPDVHGSGRRDKELPALHPPPRDTLPPPPMTHGSFSGVQFTLPPPSSAPGATTMTAQSPLPGPPFAERIPQLPHLQVTIPQASSRLHAPPPPLLLLSAPPSVSSLPSSATNARINGPTPGPGSTVRASIDPSDALNLQLAQPPLVPIVLPPAHRSLPPLPDFLNSREAFDPNIAATGGYYQLRNEQLNDHYQA